MRSAERAEMKLPENIHRGFAVYKITNLVNGKSYIGMTGDVKRRFQAHMTCVRRNRGKAIHAAIRKYGSSSFEFKVLIYCGSAEYAFDVERKLIAALGTQINGYNITAGGDGVRSITPEAMDRIRKSLSRSLRGVPKSPEHIESMRKSRIGVKFSESHREAISAARKGKKASEESKAHMSAMRKGKRPHKNTIAALMDALRRPKSDDHKNKLSEAARKSRGRRVECVEALITFSCILDAMDWLVENGHEKACPSAIGRVCRGSVPRAYGYTWRYVEDAALKAEARLREGGA